MNIKGKIGLITGGTGGIGSLIVKRLLRESIKFIGILDLDTPHTRQVFDELEKEYGARVGFYPCDVTKTAQLAEIFDKVIEKYKTIDILLNNAGIITENTPELMMDINYKAVVMGSLLMIERVGKHKGGNGGLIVNTASTLGLINMKLPVYASTKHAVVSFTRTMEEHFDVTGVRVVAMCPGATMTPLLDMLTKSLDFIDTTTFVDGFPVQSADKVADACIHIITNAKPGEVWVIENSQPPYAVKDIGDYESLRVSK